MLISSYQKFINVQILEGLREMKFVLSPSILELLAKINHVISDKLVELHNDLDSSKKQTFVDICDNKDDTITFIQSNKASDLLNIGDMEAYQKIDKRLLKSIPVSQPVYKQFRTEIGIGRFINNVFGASTFPASSRSTLSDKPNDVESFVNMYKSVFNQDEKFALMELVRGDKISYWYNNNHYAYDDRGSLGSSCMSDVSARYFNIYVNNPNVGLLILYKNSNKRKIKGRAVVWEGLIQPEGRIFMDRIYTNDSSDEQVFKDYAKRHGWLYKSHQGYGSSSQVVDPTNNTSTQLTLKSQLTPTDHSRYPYMDTMCYYNPSNGKISNRENGMRYILTDTGGHHGELDYRDETEVMSNYEHGMIYQSQAKWCEFGQDWVLENHAIKVWNTDNKYAVPGNPDIVKSFIPNFVDKHFEKARCIWSDYCNTWIFYSSVREIWGDFDRTINLVDYKKRSGVTFAEVNNEFWKIDLCEKVEGKWKLKKEIAPIVRQPVNKPKGWKEKDEFIDREGHIFKKGIYIGKK